MFNERGTRHLKQKETVWTGYQLQFAEAKKVLYSDRSPTWQYIEKLVSNQAPTLRNTI